MMSVCARMAENLHKQLALKTKKKNNNNFQGMIKVRFTVYSK